MPEQYSGRGQWPEDVLWAKAWCWYEGGRKTAPSSFKGAFDWLTKRLGITRTKYGQKSERAGNVTPPDGHYGIAVNLRRAGLYALRQPLSLHEHLDGLDTYVEASRSPGALTVWLRVPEGPDRWQDVTGSGCQTLPVCPPVRKARPGEVEQLEELLALLW